MIASDLPLTLQIKRDIECSGILQEQLQKLLEQPKVLILVQQQQIDEQKGINSQLTQEAQLISSQLQQICATNPQQLAKMNQIRQLLDQELDMLTKQSQSLDEEIMEQLDGINTLINQLK